MGRLQGLHESFVMSAAEVATLLLNGCATLPAYKSYMFGSYVDSVGVDIDILIVGEAGEKMAKLKREFVKAGEQLPLHVLYMNPQEEQETDFVSQQNCVSLVQLANRANRQASTFALKTGCTIINDG